MSENHIKYSNNSEGYRVVNYMKYIQSKMTTHYSFICGQVKREICWYPYNKHSEDFVVYNEGIYTYPFIKRVLLDMEMILNDAGIKIKNYY